MRHHQNYGKRHNPHTSRRVRALPKTALRHICFLHNIPVRAELLHTGMSTLSTIQGGGRVIVHSPEFIRNVFFVTFMLRYIFHYKHTGTNVRWIGNRIKVITWK